VTVAQAREVRCVALLQARQSGLDEEKAALLADAFVWLVEHHPLELRDGDLAFSVEETAPCPV
jgi:hypothetical protein